MDTIEAAGICCCDTEEYIPPVIVIAEETRGIYSDLLELLEYYKEQVERDKQ